MEATITTDAELLANIEAFCRAHDLAPTTFGRMATGDGSLIPNLRSGRSPTLKLAGRIVEFMVSYPLGNPNQASAA